MLVPLCGQHWLTGMAVQVTLASRSSNEALDRG
jgi:hypothetical protein